VNALLSPTVTGRVDALEPVRLNVPDPASTELRVGALLAMMVSAAAREITPPRRQVNHAVG